MQFIERNLHNTKLVLTIVAVLGFFGFSPVLGADPEIHVAWDSGTPIQDFDYQVSGSVDFPDVKLITGNLTWKIWSTDTDNPDGIGDIGVISSPYAANFGVKIEDDQGNPGAREVKGINLDPSSTTNYSSLTGGKITGDLTGDLFLQESTGGEGGTATFTIGGNVLADMTIPHAAGFTVTAGNAVWYVYDYCGGGIATQHADIIPK